MNSTEQISLVF